MNTFLRLIALIAFGFVFSNLQAQDKRIDSIRTVFQNQKLHDTAKLAALNKLMLSHYNQNEPNFFVIVRWMGAIGQKALRENKHPLVRKRVNVFMGTYYSALAIESFSKGRIDQSVAYEDRAIKVYKDEKDWDEMYYHYIIQAQFLQRANQTEKAISQVFKALKYYDRDKAKNVGEIAYGMATLGSIYAAQKNYRQAIAYHKKTIQYYDRDSHLSDIQKNYMKAVDLANIGNSYQQLAQHDSAIAYLGKAIVVYRKNNDTQSIAMLVSKMAAVKLNQEKYVDAEKLLGELSGPMDQRTQAHTDLQWARLYSAKSDYGKAKPYAEKALAISKANKLLDLQEMSATLLYEISRKTGNYKMALEMHVFNDKLKDSSKTEASKNALLQQQLRYDFEKKELNLKLTAQKQAAVKNNWLIALSGVVLLLLLGGFFYYRNSRQKQAIAALEKNKIKQKLLLSQMNPHFIFNSVDSIQGLIFKNRNKEAVDYLNKFSKLTRQILENSSENYIPLGEEILMIENYLAIQQVLHDNKFSFSLEVSDIPDPDSILLPPMLTQPHIENAIKHGLADKDGGGKITIRFYLKEAKLFFEVEDNGLGFDNDIQQGKHKSMAIKITRERLEYYDNPDDFIVQNDNLVQPDGKVTGARVSFKIPYIYEN